MPRSGLRNSRGSAFDDDGIIFQGFFFAPLSHSVKGQHKIARGYLPEAVYSAHWIADPALREPVARYLDQERRAVAEDMGYLTAEFSPFKNET